MLLDIVNWRVLIISERVIKRSWRSQFIQLTDVLLLIPFQVSISCSIEGALSSYATNITSFNLGSCSSESLNLESETIIMHLIYWILKPKPCIFVSTLLMLNHGFLNGLNECWHVDQINIGLHFFAACINIKNFFRCTPVFSSRPLFFSHLSLWIVLRWRESQGLQL